jgi:hypothetical protein
MQLCNCKLSLSGDRNHVVFKRDVSVAEIEILRALHGPDSVTDIVPTRMQRGVAGAAVLDELRRKYKGNVATIEGPKRGIVDLVFPGPRPALPSSVKDIGLDWKGDPKPGKGEVVEEEVSLTE